ncbi:MAG: hypothetical protein GY847_21510 [Proteobacteria bacterium]|nr:hypothetical protein [Pseudomonadota bacterium]
MKIEINKPAQKLQCMSVILIFLFAGCSFFNSNGEGDDSCEDEGDYIIGLLYGKANIKINMRIIGQSGYVGPVLHDLTFTVNEPKTTHDLGTLTIDP